MKTALVVGIPPVTSSNTSKAGWHGWPADAPAIAPFNAEQAQQHQEAWAAHFKLSVQFTNSIGMKFRLIPPGEFLMGTNPSFYSATGPGKEAVANLETGNHPMETVSWYDAAEFCAKLSKQEKLKPFYSRYDESVTALEGTGYRLPTEKEYE